MPGKDDAETEGNGVNVLGLGGTSGAEGVMGVIGGCGDGGTSTAEPLNGVAGILELGDGLSTIHILPRR